MDTTTVSPTGSNTPHLDAILAGFDMSAAMPPASPAKPADLADRAAVDELPPALREQVRRAGSKAFHLALANDATKEAAIEAGRAAAGAKFDELVAGAPGAPLPVEPAPAVEPAAVTFDIPDLIAPEALPAVTAASA
ncbi:MAG: hypothetical protein EKK55_02555, partial [Rhodocyclaceae bacterium]